MSPASPLGPNPLPVEVRLVRADAWRRWREIRLRSLLECPTAFGSTYERERGWGEAEYAARLGDDSPAVLATAGGEMVGMGAGFSDVPGWLLVIAMWVEPTWRGRGVGTRVLAELVGWAQSRGLRTHLDVTVGNHDARAAYERFGFVGTGETGPLREGSAHRVERMVFPRPGR